jgi:acylphosphatase
MLVARDRMPGAGSRGPGPPECVVISDACTRLKSMTEIPDRRRVRAHGRVQGVFFRDSVRREAARRGVAGWARNCADGTVEAVFEGPPDAVAAMVDYCRAGPGHAEVWRLDEQREPAEGLSGFAVR